MKRAFSIYATVLLAAVALPSLSFGADQVPDVKGDWVGKTHTIIAGRGGHWPASIGTFDKPGLYEKDIVIKVTGQTDRRIWGRVIITGKDGKTEEPFVGELTGKDNRHFVTADTDGYVVGDISDDNVLSFCYMQAGNGPSHASVVSCTDVKLKR
jgi:hypothetical protein